MRKFLVFLGVVVLLAALFALPLLLWPTGSGVEGAAIAVQEGAQVAPVPLAGLGSIIPTSTVGNLAFTGPADELAITGPLSWYVKHRLLTTVLAFFALPSLVLAYKRYNRIATERSSCLSTPARRRPVLRQALSGALN